MKRVPLGNLRDIVAERELWTCQHCAVVTDQGDLHHKLFRAAGGTVADGIAVTSLANGTFDVARHTAHLMWLCHEPCHLTLAHGPDNVALGLRILGQMRHERWSGLSWYEGSDVEFAALWPKEVAA